VIRLEPLVIPNILKIDLVFYTIIQIVRMFVDLIRDHLAVPDPDDAGRIEIRQLLLMSHQYHQFFLRNRLDDIHYFQRILAVQVPRWLIRDHNGWILDDRTGNADSLPFSSGEHIGIPVAIPVHTHFVQNVINFLLDLFLVFDTDHLQCNGNVIKDRHIVHKIIILENISHIEISDLIYLPGTPAVQLFPVDVNVSAADLIQSADHI